MRVEQKPLTGIAAITHLTATLQDPHRLNEKLTLLFELHQARRIRSHFHLKNICYSRLFTLFSAKKNTSCFAAIESNFVLSRIVTTNIHKTLQPTNTGDEHEYCISSANITLL